MSKREFTLVLYVVLVTLGNIYLWFQVVDGGAAPRSGRIIWLIVSLAVGAVFSDKLSRSRYAPEFIRVGCLLGMTVMLFILFKQV